MHFNTFFFQKSDTKIKINFQQKKSAEPKNELSYRSENKPLTYSNFITLIISFFQWYFMLIFFESPVLIPL